MKNKILISPLNRFTLDEKVSLNSCMLQFFVINYNHCINWLATEDTKGDQSSLAEVQSFLQ